MQKDVLAQKIVSRMMETDYFSQWMGVNIISAKEGYSKIQMTLRKEMLNGFAIAHGGITYSLADSALAFASNSHGRKAVSIETSISHTVSLMEGDVITANAVEVSLKEKIAIYNITIKKEKHVVALFKGTVYRTSKNWEI